MNTETSPRVSCPPEDMLVQLVSGSLTEQYADKLFRHIEDCDACQGKMDEIDRRQNLMLEFAEANPETEVSAEVVVSKDREALDQMIRRAQEEARNGDTSSGSRSGTTRVGWDDFVNGFRRCGLLPAEEVESCLDAIKEDNSVNFTDSGSIAQALVNRRKLTAFQARVLLRGRWKGLVLGKYAILDSLGQGGMGNVFKARHKRLGRVVCLKVINSAGRQSPVVIDRFRNEAKALARLSHPNIVTAHDADESKGVPFLVMEYIEGSDLAKHVRAHGPLPIDQALHATLQTARALEYAHRQGVIHRDVKPHNLFLVNDPKTGNTMVKVLDLGLARFDTMMIDNPDASLLTAMTNTGVVIGTVDYMSPEQALDSRTADARSDIYSLGCTLHFLLTGRAPFAGDTMMQRLIAHREQPVPSLADAGAAVPMELDTCVKQMLQKQPDDRYQSMAMVAEDIESMLRGESPAGIVRLQTEGSEIADSVSSVPFAPPIQNQVESPPVKFRRRQTPAYQMRSRWETILPVAAAICALCLTLTAVYMTVGERLLARQGAARAIQNGGDGRALILVSHDWFNEEEYSTVVSTLRGHGYDIVTAAPSNGKKKEEFGVELKRQTTNISLQEVRAEAFDAVFFVSSHTDDLKHIKENSKAVSKIVKSSVQQGLLLSSVGPSWHVIGNTGVLKDCKLQHYDNLQIGTPTDSGAMIVQTWESKHITNLLIKSHEVLSQRKKQAEANAQWWEKLL